MEFERLAKNAEKAFCCAENGRLGGQWKAVTIALQLGVLNSFDRVFNKNPFFYTVEMWKTMLKVLKTRLNPVEILFFWCYSASFFSWKTSQNWRGKPQNAGEKSIPLVENLVVILTGKRCNTVCLTIQRAIRVFNTVGENCVEKCRKGWGKGASNQQMGGEK